MLPEPIAVKHGITLYRVQYRTTNYDGAQVVASGLVALPGASRLHSVVAYHHGTNAERRTAPSQSGVGEGLLIAAAAAGTGHVLVAPDYIGLGESREIHPYMCSKVTATTSIDLMRAARKLVEYLHGSWPNSLFLLGFSQGGHATLAVHRELEILHEPQFTVTASAPVAGPFYLRDVSFPQALNRYQPVPSILSRVPREFVRPCLRQDVGFHTGSALRGPGANNVRWRPSDRGDHDGPAKESQGTVQSRTPRSL